MNHTVDISQEPDLGYLFYPLAGNGIFGNSRLDVIMHQHPTLRHYDPESVRCTVAGTESAVTLLIHYTTQSAHYRVCAGRILITDRVEKHVEAFCFGGTLDIIHRAQETICVFQSPVPILDMNTYHSPDMLLANEVEILIAERRAAWDPQHPHDFAAHLAQLDPTALFATSLEVLTAKFSNRHFLLEPSYRQFFHMLEEERDTWQKNGRWPITVPRLTDLL